MPEEPKGDTPQATPPAIPTTPETATTETTPAAPPAEQPKGDSEENKFRRLFEKEQKERESLAKKLQEIEDAKLSNIDKANKRAQELEAENQRLRMERLRTKIMAESGLDPSDEVFIVGTDEEAMRESAQRLASRLGAAPRAAGTITAPGTSAQPTMAEQIEAAERSGNRPEAIRLKRLQAFGPGH